MNRTILVPIDYSDVTDAVLEEARRLAGGLGAALHLVHAETMDPMVYSPYQARMGAACPRSSREQMLLEATDRLATVAGTCRPDVRSVTISLLDGHAGPGIMEEALRVRPMMIVMGSHGHGALHHLLAGSVCEYVMKHAVCPIVIVPSRVGTYDLDVRAVGAVTSA
jgi:nucleotide-binding universal stress UspA family protein